jgi:hypothetical protein
MHPQENADTGIKFRAGTRRYLKTQVSNATAKIRVDIAVFFCRPRAAENHIPSPFPHREFCICASTVSMTLKK